MRVIKKHFNNLDQSNTGTIDASDLSKMLREADKNLSEADASAEANKIIKAADDDGDGKIQFKEFSQLWQRKLLKANASYVHAVFTVLDENSDGFIDKAELKKVLEIYDDDAVDSIIKEVDTNGDGKLSFEEFKVAMQEIDISSKAENAGVSLDKMELHKSTKDITAADIDDFEGDEDHDDNKNDK